MLCPLTAWQPPGCRRQTIQTVLKINTTNLQCIPNRRSFDTCSNSYMFTHTLPLFLPLYVCFPYSFHLLFYIYVLVALHKAQRATHMLSRNHAKMSLSCDNMCLAEGRTNSRLNNQIIISIFLIKLDIKVSKLLLIIACLEYLIFCMAVIVLFLCSSPHIS